MRWKRKAQKPPTRVHQCSSKAQKWQQGTEKTMTDDKEFMRQFTRPKYVTTELVRSDGGNVGVIINPCIGEFKEFTNDGEVVKKPYIVVEIKGDSYEYTLTERQARDFVNEKDMGLDRNKWVGKKLKFQVDKAGNKEYIRAFLIS